MKFLIDTHVLIWILTDTRKLSARTRSLLEDYRNQFSVSAVTFWEMAIKIRTGRLAPVGKWDTAIPYVEQLGFQTIPLLPEEAATVGRLTEETHFDPFDRMLIWQAITRGLTLISRDQQFERFKKDGLKLLWD
ncbi:MAG: type II toxin-antitoxin system VapC family toxin [Pyrinomonadaceae bacterium]